MDLIISSRVVTSQLRGRSHQLMMTSRLSWGPARVADYATVTRFGPKVGQIGPKWVKSGNFFRSDSVHFGSVSQNVLNLI